MVSALKEKLNQANRGWFNYKGEEGEIVDTKWDKWETPMSDDVRASILLDNLESLLGEHPVIEADQNFKDLYDAAFNNLHQLYQKLGE